LSSRTNAADARDRFCDFYFKLDFCRSPCTFLKFRNWVFCFPKNITALMFQSLLYNSMKTLSNWYFENTHRLEAEYYYLEWRLSSSLYRIFCLLFVNQVRSKRHFDCFDGNSGNTSEYLVHQRNCLFIVFLSMVYKVPL
jgi:hypothetical protein